MHLKGAPNSVITYDENANMSKALTDVQAAVARVTTFPSDIESPVVTQVANADEVCRLNISGPFSEQALKVYARMIRDDLLDRGLTRVDIIGARPSEIWVEVPEAALRELDMSLDDISTRVARTSMDMPSGSIESGGRSRQIRSEGLARSPQEVGDIEIVTKTSGEKLRLRDVATIHEGYKRELDFEVPEG